MTNKAKKQYHAEVVLNTTKAPHQVRGEFIAADKAQIKLRGTIGDDIGKIIIVPMHSVRVVYLTEAS